MNEFIHGTDVVSVVKFGNGKCIMEGTTGLK